MDSNNRIQTTSIVATVGRQTPKRDFGDELVNVMGQGVQIGAGIIGSAVNGSPVVSAAVSGVSGAVSAVSGVASSRSAMVSSGLTSIQGGTQTGAAGTSGITNLEKGGAMDSLARQEAMNKDSQAFSAMYLQLQDQMQQESRQYNSISNIIKVRHDSAKAAINNIR